MIVINRNGQSETFEQQKISTFVKHAVNFTPSLETVDVSKIVKQVNKGIADNMNTEELAPYIAEVASSYSTESYEYGILAGRIEVMTLHNNTPTTFTEAMRRLKGIMSTNFMNKVDKI